ncbi:hypothetical protein [Pelagibacterium sp. H642]|uniref:hypothetical protein n=1 Tax=Pelagibacterium sp. H642 TaxID=1881069 RepID=UPI002814F2B9|nr:hypothetical protein [Pelagibacterium sp. H642]WMT90995.1 hypothetical protein NO934_01700 [Pelagibacterium sp. H642]
MPRPRTPKAKAELEARDHVNAGRFKNRTEPTVTDPVGEPPEWIVDNELTKARTAWNTFTYEIPWLNRSHRSFLEIASNIRGRLMTGQEVGVQALNLLRQCLGQMGATPADASKVAIPDGEDEKDDLLD